MPLPRFTPADDVSGPELDRALRLVLLDGLTTQVMVTATTGVFLVGYALQFDASNFIIGLLAAIPFFGQMVQLPGILLVERVRVRRAVCVVASLIGRLALVVAALAPFLPPAAALPTIILAIAVQAGVGALSGCSWNSWMRDLIPGDRLGSFFGRRLFFTTALGVALSLAIGRFIDWWQATWPDHAAHGYSLLFILGAVAGLLGVVLLGRTPEPRMAPPVAPVPLRVLLMRPFRDKNFRRLMRFLAPWSFAMNLAAPFFTVYMLEMLDLEMSAVIALTVISQVANLAALNTWGRVTDRFSNKSVLAVSGPLFVLCIFGWTFTSFPTTHALTVPLLVALHLAMGIALAGVTLATGNIALKLSPPGEATSFLAVNAIVSSFAAGIAPILGGAFADVFAARELRLVVHWTSPRGDLDIHALSFEYWDFFFMLAFVIGLLALQQLRHVVEIGDTDQRTVVRAFVLEARRGFHNLSSIGGLRQAANFPFALLLRRRRRENGLAADAQ